MNFHDIVKQSFNEEVAPPSLPKPEYDPNKENIRILNGKIEASKKIIENLNGQIFIIQGKIKLEEDKITGLNQQLSQFSEISDAAKTAAADKKMRDDSKQQPNSVVATNGVVDQRVAVTPDSNLAIRTGPNVLSVR